MFAKFIHEICVKVEDDLGDGNATLECLSYRCSPDDKLTVGFMQFSADVCSNVYRRLSLDFDILMHPTLGAIHYRMLDDSTMPVTLKEECFTSMYEAIAYVVLPSCYQSRHSHVF